MTVIEKIKEIEEAIASIKTGEQVNKRWSPNSSLRTQPIKSDFEFLLKAYKVAWEMMKEANSASEYNCFNETEEEFESRMK